MSMVQMNPVPGTTFVEVRMIIESSAVEKTQSDGTVFTAVTSAPMTIDLLSIIAVWDMGFMQCEEYTRVVGIELVTGRIRRILVHYRDFLNLLGEARMSAR